MHGTIHSFFLRSAGVSAIALASCVASAGVIELEFTGMDIEYDGSTISAVNDDLTSVIVLEDDVVTAGSPFVADISLDLNIPGVTGIAAGGDQVVSGAGGSLTLNMPGGDFLDLELDEVTVTFAVVGSAQFSFGASIAGINGQSLPGGLVINDPLTVSFSTTLDSLSTNGVEVLAFTASGTGEIEDRIPEPTSAALLAMACLAARFNRRR